MSSTEASGAAEFIPPLPPFQAPRPSMPPHPALLADPTLCPWCFCPATGNPRCAACGYPLMAGEAAQIAAISGRIAHDLEERRTLLEQANARAHAIDLAAHESELYAQQALYEQHIQQEWAMAQQMAYAPAYQPVQPPAPRIQLSVQLVLLMVGISLLCIAAIIGLTVAWLVLDLGLKTFVTTTAVLAAAAGVSVLGLTRLKQTAEGLSLFVTVLAVLDVWLVQQLTDGQVPGMTIWGAGLILVGGLHAIWHAVAGLRAPLGVAASLTPIGMALLLAGLSEDAIPVGDRWMLAMVGIAIVSLAHPFIRVRNRPFHAMLANWPPVRDAQPALPDERTAVTAWPAERYILTGIGIGAIVLAPITQWSATLIGSFTWWGTVGVLLGAEICLAHWWLLRRSESVPARFAGGVALVTAPLYFHAFTARLSNPANPLPGLESGWAHTTAVVVAVMLSVIVWVAFDTFARSKYAGETAGIMSSIAASIDPILRGGVFAATLLVTLVTVVLSQRTLSLDAIMQEAMHSDGHGGVSAIAFVIAVSLGAAGHRLLVGRHDAITAIALSLGSAAAVVGSFAAGWPWSLVIIVIAAVFIAGLRVLLVRSTDAARLSVMLEIGLGLSFAIFAVSALAVSSLSAISAAVAGVVIAAACFAFMVRAEQPLRLFAGFAMAATLILQGAVTVIKLRTGTDTSDMHPSVVPHPVDGAVIIASLLTFVALAVWGWTVRSQRSRARENDSLPSAPGPWTAAAAVTVTGLVVASGLSVITLVGTVLNVGVERASGFELAYLVTASALIAAVTLVTLCVAPSAMVRTAVGALAPLLLLPILFWSGDAIGRASNFVPDGSVFVLLLGSTALAASALRPVILRTSRVHRQLGLDADDELHVTKSPSGTAPVAPHIGSIVSVAPMFGVLVASLTTLVFSALDGMSMQPAPRSALGLVAAAGATATALIGPRTRVERHIAWASPALLCAAWLIGSRSFGVGKEWITEVSWVPVGLIVIASAVVLRVVGKPPREAAPIAASAAAIGTVIVGLSAAVSALVFGDSIRQMATVATLALITLIACVLPVTRATGALTRTAAVTMTGVLAAASLLATTTLKATDPLLHAWPAVTVVTAALVAVLLSTIGPRSGTDRQIGRGMLVGVTTLAALAAVVSAVRGESGWVTNLLVGLWLVAAAIPLVVSAWIAPRVHPRTPALTMLGARISGGVLVSAAIVLAIDDIFRGMLLGIDPVPERWCYPLGAAGVAVGWAFMHRVPAVRSWPALGPGIAIATVPVLMAEPVSADWARILVLAVIAVACVVVGAFCRLQAPLVLGSIVTVLHALIAFWPQVVLIYEAVPLWVWLAAAGTIITVIAATYEARLNDAKRVAQRIGSLR